MLFRVRGNAVCWQGGTDDNLVHKVALSESAQALGPFFAQSGVRMGRLLTLPPAQLIFPKRIVFTW
jgi:hypothetical protein